MKAKLWIACILALLAVAALAAPPNQRTKVPKGVAGLDSKVWIDANRILMFVTNDGSFAEDLGGLLGKTDGLYYPFTSLPDIKSGKQKNTVIFASGLWMGAKDSATGETRVSVAEYSEENVPGPMKDSTFSLDSPNFRVFRIGTALDDTTGRGVGVPINDKVHWPDWADWPVEMGAPVDSLGNPALIGDQMTWAVYNDADPAAHTNNAGSTEPLGVEVQQTTIGFNRQGALGDIVFVKFKLRNRGPNTLDSMYVSLWADPDLGDASDDLVGCDTVLSLGYCYNGNAIDGDYGSRPPAVGYDFFQGPLQQTGDSADTARMWGQKWPGYKNLPMSSFNKYINGTDPQTFVQTYNYMKGLQANGLPPTNGSAFQAWGDPVAKTGDLDANPADRRMFLTTGPFTFRPGDSTEIVAGIMVQQGANRLQSVSLLKQLDVIAQETYDNNFVVVKPPATPRVRVTNQFGEIVLAWDDTSEVDPGDAPFQGYTVLQGPSASGPWTILPLQTYDVVDGVTTIIDSLFDLESALFLPKAVKFGTDAGIKRYYTTTTDALTGRPLQNLTQYFFRVEAYSYDPNLRKGDKTPTSAAILTVTPQGATANVDRTYKGNDVIPTEQTGPTTGTVHPIVVDANGLTGHDYRVTFDTIPNGDTVITPVLDTIEHTYRDSVIRGDSVVYFNRIWFDTLEVDTTITTALFWRLYDVTANDTLLYDSMRNLSGDDNYPLVGGTVVKVTGAPVGLKSGEPGDVNAGWAVPSGTRQFTQIGGDGFTLEGFRGAAGYAADLYGTTVGPLDLKDVELRLATVDAAGVFDTTQENVSFGYRYLRGANAAAADSSFIPYIINTAASWDYQQFNRNIPLSAWDITVDPPRRLAVGFLENNAANGLVNGVYWPPFNGDPDHGDNIAGTGPREWLFIFNHDYSETADPALQMNIFNNALPWMYVCMWTRRYDGGWSQDGLDAFDLFANVPITPSDSFTFTQTTLTKSTSGGAARLDKVRAVPNPYYLFSNYDQSTNSRQIRFSNLPEKCTITIYTIAGDLVSTVNKNSTDSWASWDVQTSNGIPVASGIYIWVVDAPGIGQKIGKLAVFTEVEQLPTY